jgi:hypothetical protein
MVEFLLGLVHAFGGLAIAAIFYWPGWLALKILTLGRFPRSGSRRIPHTEGNVAEIEFVSFAGALFVLGLAALAYTFWPGR